MPPTAPPMAAPVESDDLETDAPTSEMFKMRGEAGGGANVGEGGGLGGGADSWSGVQGRRLLRCTPQLPFKHILSLSRKRLDALHRFRQALWHTAVYLHPS